MTLPQLFDRAQALRKVEPAFSMWTPRVEHRLTSSELARQVARFAAGLQALGLRKGDRVLLISENRPEWAVTDYATAFTGGILVPVYTSLTVDQLRYLLDNSGARIAVASTQALLDKLIAAAAGVRSLRQMVVIDQAAAAPEVMHFASVASMGDDALARSPGAWREEAARLRPEEVATIIYTSGTTGPPKGVMLSHGNLTANVETLCRAMTFEGIDTALSFLPLCHVTQRLADYCYFSQGLRIVYVGLEDLSAGLREVGPGTFPGVPRVFEKARDSILLRIGAGPAPRRALARWALGVARRRSDLALSKAAIPAWLRLRHALADRLVLSRIRDGMGGRLRYAVCGGAPLNPEVMRFFHSIGVPVLEGYGLTETTVLCLNHHDDPVPGTVGPPLPDTELRVAEDGELLARGPGVCRGYYLDVKATEAAFADGWFRTGDLARFDESGRVIITGRKKELLVTSGGKKVSPALIEQRLAEHHLVSQVALVGDGRKYLSALVVPDRERLTDWCRRQGLTGGNGARIEELIARSEVRQLYETIISETNGALARYEQIKKFTLLDVEFSMEGGELTPTLKLKRRVVEEKYRAQIDAMYSGS